MTSPAPRRANVIGLGLIGGSIGLALRARGWTVHGEDTDAPTQHAALERHVVDAAGLDPDAEVVEALEEGLRITPVVEVRAEDRSDPSP